MSRNSAQSAIAMTTLALQAGTRDVLAAEVDAALGSAFEDQGAAVHSFEFLVNVIADQAQLLATTLRVVEERTGVAAETILRGMAIALASGGPEAPPPRG